MQSCHLVTNTNNNISGGLLFPSAKMKYNENWLGILPNLTHKPLEDADIILN